MKKLMKRLRSRAGETLVESLASILIFTFSAIIMMTMLTTAANINKTAKDAAQAHQAMLAEVDGMDPTKKIGGLTPTVTVECNGSTTQTVPVAAYGDADGLHAYYAGGN